MKILLVGGGSGGSVSPLLAVAQEIRASQPKTQFLLVGTKNGPEGPMARASGVAFAYITSGKLRRYFSLKNLLAPVLTIYGFFQARKILAEFKPDCIFGAGSFVEVPVVWAGKLSKIPVVLHQQDVVASLANKLCQWAAKKITVSFAESLSSFSSSLGIFYRRPKSEKIILTGNPFREELKHGSKQGALRAFNLKSDLPTLLVLGGGTGSQFLNELIIGSAPTLSKSWQIIHSTGKHKNQGHVAENYHAYEFIENMADAYAVADIVVARAGLSTLTELSNLKKVSIIVPMPNSHQEINSLILLKQEAALVLDQKKIKPNNFSNLLRKLLFAHEAQASLKNNIAKIMPHSASKKIANIIIKLSEKYVH